MSGSGANAPTDLATSTSEAGQDDVNPIVAVESSDRNEALRNMSPDEVISLLLSIYCSYGAAYTMQ